MFRLRSVRSIVIAPARTGSESRSSTTVITTAQTNRGIRSSCIPCQRIFITVVMKLIAPKIDDAPARCSEKIAKSTEGPAWAIFDAKGG